VKWSEYSIARSIATDVLDKKCIVLVDNCGWTGYECDVLAVTNDLRIIDVEVKISRADLKADAKKDKWWHRVTTGYEYLPGKTRRSAVYRFDALPHPPKVWKHYYALPKDIWKPELFECLPSASSGVLLMSESNGRVTTECIRRAIPARDAYKLTSGDVVAIARLANLRMWATYLREDIRQLKAKIENDTNVA
jgi:hypothetical protein